MLEDAWQVLVQAGLPDGAARARPTTIDLAEVERAPTEITQTLNGLTPPRREILFAYLCGWRHHWETSFEQLGQSGRVLLASLEADVIDPNRYLKLRRIAIENLSGVL